MKSNKSEGPTHNAKAADIYHPNSIGEYMYPLNIKKLRSFGVSLKINVCKKTNTKDHQFLQAIVVED